MMGVSDFTTRMYTLFRNRFHNREDIAEVVQYCREQKVPGKLEIIFPGNGGITSIEFIETRETVLEKTR